MPTILSVGQMGWPVAITKIKTDTNTLKRQKKVQRRTAKETAPEDVEVGVDAHSGEEGPRAAYQDRQDVFRVGFGDFGEFLPDEDPDERRDENEDEGLEHFAGGEPEGDHVVFEGGAECEHPQGYHTCVE